MCLYGCRDCVRVEEERVCVKMYGALVLDITTLCTSISPAVLQLTIEDADDIAILTSFYRLSQVSYVGTWEPCTLYIKQVTLTLCVCV